MLTIQRALKGGKARISRISAWLQTKAGGNGHFCNSCRQPVARFYTYGGRPWGCPLCRSSTRERFVLELIQCGRLSFDDSIASVLHVAPSELGVIRLFDKIADYQPADLFPELYRLTNTQKMDLMELEDTDRFDLVYLSHVMEHVPDDRRVYQNLYRSLKPLGQAWVIVPLWNQPTIDGSFDMPGLERERRFGQWDHVRQYGPDLKQRMEECGFKVNILKSNELPQNKIDQLGLSENDWLFRGVKL